MWSFGFPLGFDRDGMVDSLTAEIYERTGQVEQRVAFDMNTIGNHLTMGQFFRLQTVQSDLQRFYRFIYGDQKAEAAEAVAQTTIGSSVVDAALNL